MTRFAAVAMLALGAVAGCAPGEEATVVTGRGVPWQSADAYLQRAETADGACYVLIRKAGDSVIGVSCVVTPDAGGR